ncbi:hypothetical protein HDU91_005735 [Kappamyces sp. JEL0680]|nr:hypothetical protein HDU91_005735 [Kappamyces sp. JEL0680]
MSFHYVPPPTYETFSRTPTQTAPGPHPSYNASYLAPSSPVNEWGTLGQLSSVGGGQTVSNQSILLSDSAMMKQRPRNAWWHRSFVVLVQCLVCIAFLLYWSIQGFSFSPSFPSWLVLSLFDILTGFIAVCVMFAIGTLALVWFDFHLKREGIKSSHAAGFAVMLSNISLSGSHSSYFLLTYLSSFILIGLLHSAPALYKSALVVLPVVSSSVSKLQVSLNGLGGCNALYCSITSQALMYNQTADYHTLRYQACLDPSFVTCFTPMIPEYGPFAEQGTLQSQIGFGQFKAAGLPGIRSTANCSVNEVAPALMPNPTGVNTTWQGQVDRVSINVTVLPSASNGTASHQIRTYVKRSQRVWYVQCQIDFSIAQGDVTWTNDERGASVHQLENLVAGSNFISGLPSTFQAFDDNLMVPLQNTIGAQHSSRLQNSDPQEVRVWVAAFAQSYAAMTGVRSAFRQLDGTPTTTFAQGISWILELKTLSLNYGLEPAAAYTLSVLLFILAMFCLWVGIYRKPIYCGSPEQLLSLASGMHSAFGGGSAPVWMKDSALQEKVIKLRFKAILDSNGHIIPLSLINDRIHLEFAPVDSSDHLDLTLEEFQNIHRLNLD